jgi:hypothetical protein
MKYSVILASLVLTCFALLANAKDKPVNPDVACAPYQFAMNGLNDLGLINQNDPEVFNNVEIKVLDKKILAKIPKRDKKVFPKGYDTITRYIHKATFRGKDGKPVEVIMVSECDDYEAGYAMPLTYLLSPTYLSLDIHQSDWVPSSINLINQKYKTLQAQIGLQAAPSSKTETDSAAFPLASAIDKNFSTFPFEVKSFLENAEVCKQLSEALNSRSSSSSSAQETTVRSGTCGAARKVFSQLKFKYQDNATLINTLLKYDSFLNAKR